MPTLAQSGIRKGNPLPDEKRTVLRNLSFGERVAEDERDYLASYFVETHQWQQLFAGQVDIVYGPKGAGKSALYAALASRRAELSNRGIKVIAAENPRGAPAFKELVDDPPATEREFIDLWKAYFVSLAGSVLKQYGSNATALLDQLADAGLVQADPEKNLKQVLASARAFGKKLTGFRFEPEIKIDTTTSTTTVVPKFSYKQPETTPPAQPRPEPNIDELLKGSELALAELNSKLWILIDRLDVAFADSPELEANALRALFKVYLDMKAFDRIKLKVFLRTDIWRRITAAGFREASHITSSLTIQWDERSLLNLVVRRILQNKAVMDFYGVHPSAILGSYEAQQKFFYRVFPDDIEGAVRKPTTFEWIIGRTRDGTQQSAPREVIHLLTSARDEQLRKIELGEGEPHGERLFTASAIKKALPEVSRARLDQTLYAEHASLKASIEKLRGKKTSQGRASLAAVWNVSPAEAEARANELVAIGFFERKERKGKPEDPEYWVPHLYRDGLAMVQGKA